MPAQPAVSSVHGTVRTAAGATVGSATVALVELSDSEAAVASTLVTAADGHFEIVPPKSGRYAITATHRDLGVAFSPAPIAAGEAPIDLTLRSETNADDVHGRLVDELGKPIADGQIELSTNDDLLGDIYVTRTDPSGGFATRVPHGRYTAKTLASGYRSEAFVLTPSKVALDLHAFRATPSNGPPSASEAQFIRQNSQDLAAVEDPFSDAWLDGVSVIGLGEQTHGAGDGIRLRFALARDLIVKHGFTVIALEADYAETLALDDWVAGKQGDEREAPDVPQLWIWRNQETRDFMRFLRTENRHRAASARIHVVGLDMQSRDNLVSAIGARLDRLATKAARGFAARLPGIKSCGDPALESVLVDGRKAFTDPLLGSLFDHLAQCAALEAPGQEGDSARDKALADNVIAATTSSASPSTKIVVLAHNAHVARTRMGIDQSRPMGELVAAKLGHAYQSVGFLIGTGSFRSQELDPATGQSPDVRNLSLDDIAAGSLEDAFTSALGATSVSPVMVSLQGASWPGPLRRMRIIGASYAPKYGAHYWHPVAVDATFDAVIFVPHTTAIARIPPKP
jgi:erythromycin esterase